MLWTRGCEEKEDDFCFGLQDGEEKKDDSCCGLEYDDDRRRMILAVGYRMVIMKRITMILDV